MNRLLQGDVGSGKTVVAAIAALIAAENGLQTAFMAPTEILARQHFETMKKLFARSLGDMARAPPARRSASSPAAARTFFTATELESKISKPEFSKKVAAGEVAIIFGTHALIQKSDRVRSARPRHNRRTASLRRAPARGAERAEEWRRQTAERRRAPIPHFLSMSATPIPRTLMLSVFGDLDLSLITELPVGRKEIKTEIVSPLKRTATYDFVREQIKEGRQVFVICPRIDAAEEDGSAMPRTTGKQRRKKLELKSVKEEYEKLSQKIFPDLRVAMLHGQMKPKEKEDVMQTVQRRRVRHPRRDVRRRGRRRRAERVHHDDRGRGPLRPRPALPIPRPRRARRIPVVLFPDGRLRKPLPRTRASKRSSKPRTGSSSPKKISHCAAPDNSSATCRPDFPDVAMEALRDPELVKHSREGGDQDRPSPPDPQFKKNIRATTKESGRVPSEGAAGNRYFSFLPFGVTQKPSRHFPPSIKPRLRFEPGERAEDDQRERHQHPLQNINMHNRRRRTARFLRQEATMLRHRRARDAEHRKRDDEARDVRQIVRQEASCRSAGRRARAAASRARRS